MGSSVVAEVSRRLRAAQMGLKCPDGVAMEIEFIEGHSSLKMDVTPSQNYLQSAFRSANRLGHVSAIKYM